MDGRFVRSKLFFITGGVRSGKSRYAEELVESFGGEVAYVATLEPGDEEMERRIERHKAHRPPGWRTVEATLDVVGAVAALEEPVVLLDCLSGWISNMLLTHEQNGEEAILDVVLGAIEELLAVVRASEKTVVVVTNEVGSGVVPAYPLGRWYRDALGLANQRVAAEADAVCLMVAGLPLVLKGSFPEVFH
ncbi:MAG: bifunctional adenosylcobinamide kinase/adenosylcobinamide-phosphate guanylyltransferase [Rubrobacteraceae bacterium]